MPPELRRETSHLQQASTEATIAALARVCHITTREAMEKTYRLWGHMIAMSEFDR